MHATLGTAEAFSHIIHKEMQVAGMPCRVEDLDRFDETVFRYASLSLPPDFF